VKNNVYRKILGYPFVSYIIELIDQYHVLREYTNITRQDKPFTVSLKKFKLKC
jgi:hypothetical protein